MQSEEWLEYDVVDIQKQKQYHKYGEYNLR